MAVYQVPSKVIDELNSVFGGNLKRNLFSYISDETITKANAGTIGEGINFIVNIDMEEVKRLEAEKKKRILDEETKARKKAEAEEKQMAREAYENEIREKQYKRLMMLLKKSKGLSDYILQQVRVDQNKQVAKKKSSQKVEQPIKLVEEDKMECSRVDKPLQEHNKRHSTRKPKPNKRYNDEDKLPLPKKTREHLSRNVSIHAFNN